MIKKFIPFIFVTALSWLGWTIGAEVGVMTAYFVSLAGALLGVYLGWKVNRMLLD